MCISDQKMESSKSCRPRWRHQVETFSSLLALCAGNSPVTGEFPPQRPVTQNFDVFFNLRLDKRLSKQQRRRWFETLSRSLWRHCNAFACQEYVITTCILITVICKYKQDILRGQLNITVLDSIANDTVKDVFLQKAFLISQRFILNGVLWEDTNCK